MQVYEITEGKIVVEGIIHSTSPRIGDEFICSNDNQVYIMDAGEWLDDKNKIKIRGYRLLK